jgi:uncharacterized protein
MERDASRRRKAVEPVFDQLRIPFAETRHIERDLPNEIGPPRDVERAAGKCFIHWRISRAVPHNAALLAERLQNGFPNGDARVFGGVVLINVQIAHRLDRKINQRMARQLFEHVIKEPDAGRDRILSRAIEIDLDIDRRFVRLAVDRACAHDEAPIARLQAGATHLDPSSDPVHQSAMSDETHPDSLIPYDSIVQDALRAVVGRVLEGIQSNYDLPGGHHFYITFKTQANDVSIPRHLAERFPDEMTVVLQNKFWDLTVDDAGFTVGLTFNQIPTTLAIPFDAITAFHDPAVDFALQFHVNADENDLEHGEHAHAENDTPIAEPIEDGSNVVAVDFGRKK